MMGDRKRLTAAELMAELEKDPAFVARRQLQDEVLNREAQEYVQAEAPLVKELQNAGAEVSSVWDLVNRKSRYPALVPILLAHLNRPYPARVREGIARALAVPESRLGWDVLVDTFRNEADASSTSVKWAIACAISAAADADTLDDLIKLVSDKRHGRNRAPLVYALARLRGPVAQAALQELESDPELSEDVLSARKKR